MARWRKEDKPCPYGLWKLSDAKAAGYICLVKGHGDPQTLWKHEFPALGLPSAPSWTKEDLSGYLKGIEKVYIVIDPEEGDEAVKQWLRNSEIRHSARLVTLDGAKDPSELYLRDPAGFKHKWAAALESAPTWQDVECSESSERAKEVWPRCEEIAKQSNILDRFEEALGRGSVIGEEGAAKLLYLALTSRFLDRPVSIAVKGHSSTGKSFLTEQVLRFFPPSAFYVLTAMSDKALAYSEEPVKHRFLVIFEAPGLQSQWASYLMRSLLGEGRISYDTVEATEDGIKPKHIEREGPTGLITTTTENSLHPENETRYFSVEVDDTPEQTSRVLLATAENINKDNRGNGEEEIGKFLALQEWLAGTNHEVVIPYAKRLAEMIPPVAVRLRRDFKAILYLIMSHAILHQASREQDDRGRIIATIEDYKAVWDLVAHIVSRGVQMTVPATMRETGQAVAKLQQERRKRQVGNPGKAMGGASLMDVANILHLNRSTVSRRVNACLEEGYLVNRETKRGQPFRLVVGDPLPEDSVVLPTPESLAKSCSLAGDSEGIYPPPPSSVLSGADVTPETLEVPRPQHCEEVQFPW